MPIFIKKHWFFTLTFIITLFIALSGKNHALFLFINHYGHMIPANILNNINYITDFESGILPILLVVITYCLRRDKILNVFLLIITFYLVFGLLKISVLEARPYIQYNPSELSWIPASLKENLSTAYHAFPSGHTGNVGIFVLTLSYLFAKNKLWLKILLLIPLVLIMLIRIMTGWHFPLDVLCASLFSFVLVAIFMPLKLKWRIKKNKNHSRNS